jgi:serine/threonine protein kinase
MAPEVFNGSYGQQVDMWGLGVMAYELCFNEYPFNSDDVETLK